MPDIFPSFDKLKKLLNIPTVPPRTEGMDAIATKQQEQLPSWKRFIAGALESIAGASTLDNPNENLRNPYGYGKTIGELTQLGMIPFPKGKKIFHGSPSMRDTLDKGFDMNRNDIHDTLGWMIHLASDPYYASEYAEGLKRMGGSGKGVIPLTSESTRIFDAFNPTSEDIARLVSGVGSNTDRYGKSKRNILIDAFKKGDLNITRGHPIRDVINYMTPEEFSKTGFDAIKYQDINQESWAFSHPSQLQGAYGGQLGQGKGIQVERSKPIELAEGKGTWIPEERRNSKIIINQAKSKLNNMPNEDEAKKYIGKLYYMDNAISSKEHDDLMEYYDLNFNPNYTKPPSALGWDVIDTGTPQGGLGIGDKTKKYYDAGLGMKQDHDNPYFSKNPKITNYTDASWNSIYTPEQGQKLIDQAEQLGINYHLYSNLDKLEKAIKSHLNNHAKPLTLDMTNHPLFADKPNLLNMSEQDIQKLNQMSNKLGYDSITSMITGMKHYPGYFSTEEKNIITTILNKKPTNKLSDKSIGLKK